MEFDINQASGRWHVRAKKAIAIDSEKKSYFIKASFQKRREAIEFEKWFKKLERDIINSIFIRDTSFKEAGWPGEDIKMPRKYARSL